MPTKTSEPFQLKKRNNYNNLAKELQSGKFTKIKLPDRKASDKLNSPKKLNKRFKNTKH
jgi:hypothetical protein